MISLCTKILLTYVKPASITVAVLIFYYHLRQIYTLSNYLGPLQGEPLDPKEVIPRIRSAFRLPANVGCILSDIKTGELDTYPHNISQILPPFHRYYEKFEVSLKYKMSLCLTTKVMSTLGTALFCFLNNPSKFAAYGRRISTEKWATSFCRNRVLHINYTHSEKVLGTKRLAFVRHPVDRFLSGFVNKCILKSSNEGVDHCYGCGDNLNCFMEHLQNHLWQVYRTNDRTRYFILNHMAPQSWFCNFKEHLEDYILFFFGNERGSSGKVAHYLCLLLNSAGVPRYLRDEIQEQIAVGKSHHSTWSTEHRLRAERELLSNETLLRMLTELYYYDFILFGYPLPKLKNHSLT